MSEQDFSRAMMQDPVLRAEAGMATEPEPEPDVRCPMCGASATKIAAGASQSDGMGMMGGGGMMPE